MTLKEQMTEKFKSDIFATETTGIIIEEVEINYCKCSLKTDGRHVNANNFVMGGAIFTLADFTFAVACNAAGIHTVTLNSQINYLRSAVGNLTCEARCVKDGKKVCFYNAEIFDDEKRIIATVSFTGCKLQ